MKKIDKTLLLTIIALSIFGIIMIYSASNIWANYKFNDSFHYFKYQLVFFLIGIVILQTVSRIDYKVYYKYANVILLSCFLLLILVLIPGVGSIRNGSRSWFGIGSLGIQPSEAAKIGLIIFSSKYLANNNDYLNNNFKGIIPLLIIALSVFGLIMLQPDLGT